jgi:hypothetical protein
MLCRVISWDLIDVSEAIALVTEEASTSETSVTLYETTRYDIPEDNRLHGRHRENLKARRLTKFRS